MGDYITIIDNGSIIETGEKKSLLMNKESYLYKNFINITDGDNNGF
jgi:ABC-type transport system involved in Fe-S cluster assembly fused permease/ATPase subunit